MNATRQICTWIIAKRWPYFTSAEHTHGQKPTIRTNPHSGLYKPSRNSTAGTVQQENMPTLQGVYPSQLRWWMYALVAWFDSIFRGSNWRSAPDSRSQAANGKPMVLFRCPFSIKLKGGPWVWKFFFLKQKLRRKRLSPDRACLYTKSIFVGRLDDPLHFRMTCCFKFPQALAAHETNSCTWVCPRHSPSLGFYVCIEGCFSGTFHFRTCPAHILSGGGEPTHQLSRRFSRVEHSFRERNVQISFCELSRTHQCSID